MTPAFNYCHGNRASVLWHPLYYHGNRTAASWHLFYYHGNRAAPSWHLLLQGYSWSTKNESILKTSYFVSCKVALWVFHCVLTVWYTAFCQFPWLRLSGSSGECPASSARTGTALCNGNMNACVDGVCTGSVCLANDLQDCQCTGNTEQLCHVCCLMNEQCISSFTLQARV